MDCKQELEKLQSEKETAIDNFLESLTEEKFEQQQEIKTKYNKMIIMLKNAANKEEKIAGLEEKRKLELEESTEELAKKKREGLCEIKDKYNQLAQKVKVDASQVHETLRKLREKRLQPHS